MGLILGRRYRQASRFGLSESQHACGELITYGGDAHLITFAPTGTGKTSGPVITNALTHPGQLIVIDIKGEVYAATAEARRAMGQEIHVLDLHDDELPGWLGSLNPIDLAAYCGTDPAAVARSFAAEMVERTGQERDRFWTDWSENLLTGAIAWLLSDCEPKERCLSALFDLFNGDDPAYRMAVLMDNKKVQNRAAYAAFSGFMQLSDRETRPSVLGSVQTHIRLFDSDLVRKLTDTTSFDLDAFVSGKPMSLYIIVPLFRLTAFRPLLRMWLSGLILAMARRKEPPKHRTLMLCDEVGNLGRIDALLTAATMLRSSDLTLWCFFQNPAQTSIYGPDAHTLIDNAGIIQIFGTKNHRLAQDLANLIGGVSPTDILRMPYDEQIILLDGRPIRCKQVRHYSDKSFNAST